MTPIPTSQLDAGDDSPKLARGSLLLAVQAINQISSVTDLDTDPTSALIARPIKVTGGIAALGSTPRLASTSGVYTGVDSANHADITLADSTAAANSRVARIYTTNGGAVNLGFSSDDFTSVTPFLTATRSVNVASALSLTATLITLTGAVSVVGVVTAAAFSGAFTGNGASINSLNAANISTGVVAPARLGTGSPSATTYLAGDGTWKTSVSGTVTAVTVTTANGVSATVTNQGTTPAFTFTLGAITPTSVTSSGPISGTSLVTTGAVLMTGATAVISQLSTTNAYGGFQVSDNSPTRQFEFLWLGTGKGASYGAPSGTAVINASTSSITFSTSDVARMVIAATGAVTINGAFNVNGLTTAAGGLAVNGATNITGALAASSLNVAAAPVSSTIKTLIAGSLAITQTSGPQYLLMGNQDSIGVNLPAVIQAANGNLSFGTGTSWSAGPGTITSNVTMTSSGQLGIGVPLGGMSGGTGNSAIAGTLFVYAPSTSSAGTVGFSMTSSNGYYAGLKIKTGPTSTANGSCDYFDITTRPGNSGIGSNADSVMIRLQHALSTTTPNVIVKPNADGILMVGQSTSNQGIITAAGAITSVDSSLTYLTQIYALANVSVLSAFSPTGQSLIFQTTASGASATERMRIDGVGVVTITSSGSCITANTSQVSTYGTSSNDIAQIATFNNVTVSTANGAPNGDTRLLAIGGFSNGLALIRNASAGGIAFSVGNNQRMLINAAGVISDSSGNELGWKNIPPVTSGFLRGGCYCITAAATIPLSAAGDTYQVYNDTATSLTLTPISGLTLRLEGTTATGNRTVLPYGKVTIWYRSGSIASISGSVT